MNWDDLRVFLATARAESLTGAGGVLRMDPATVARRITRLERATGVALFLKSPQGYRPTEAGQRLLGDAEAAEARVMRGLAGLSAEGTQLSGAVRIGAPDGCATFLLPQVCAQIARLHPGLDLQILALPRVVNLSRREADIAITVSRPDAARLRAEKLGDYRLSLAASRDWLAEHGTPQSLEDLRHARMIGYIPDMIFDAELDYLSPFGISRVPLASTSVSVQLQMARAGGGLAIVHDFALPAAPVLQRVLPEKIALTRTFWLTSHAGPRDARLERVSALLSQGMRAEIARLEALAAA
ncbi:LysR family transcriptional regulator [Gymnodinialimonas sp. 2305UL16-5]|uniref:LysR family transcriptional regulator n=1 Tax=Gymnodinialimonas mytili TaxID=3126503 RepID=UPI0030A0C265